MHTLATAVFAAIALAGPAVARADSKPGSSHPLPSSYAPRPHSSDHVYGSPIETPIVGRAHAPTKHTTAAKTGVAKAKPSAHHPTKAPRPARSAEPRRQG